jgi:Mlc titration factor MtfA (ptsG expression regulator)
VNGYDSRVLFTWFRRRRRRKLLASPFPTAWAAWLEPLPFYQLLDDAERRRLHDILRVMVAEKQWTGAGDLEVTDEMRVLVAGQAALLILEIEHDYFERVEEIILFPSSYEASYRTYRDGGVISEGAHNAGEAWYRGPVVLAWDGVRRGPEDPKDGHNLVLHEFAHKLDMLDGYVDGTPPLRGRGQYANWTRVMTEEFERLQKAARRGGRSLLDAYGATNEAEFFAVATETFFEKGVHLRRKHEALYNLLRDYYRQDPAERLARAQRR